MKTSIIIQARTGSTRMPNKIVLPFYNGETILGIIIDRLLTEFNKDSIYVATTSNTNDDIIEKIASDKYVNCFRGNEDDVLSRFVSVAQETGSVRIIRVCSDNPFLDVKALVELLNHHKFEDYLSYSVNNTPTILTHFGFWAEIVSSSALIKASELTQEKLYIEHVTNFIYNNPEIFKVKFIETNTKLNPEIRLTIDQEKDFSNAHKVYSIIKELKLDVTINNVVRIIEKNPTMLSVMKEQISINSK